MLKLALAQMNPVWEDKAANMKTAAEWVEKASKEGADMIVFPETTLTGFNIHSPHRTMPSEKKTITTFFSGLAKKNKIAILVGLDVCESGKKKGKNLAVFFDAKGKVKAEYQKIHPFSFAKEDTYCEGGNKIVFFKIKGVVCSMVICYDLRFPGLFEAIAKKKPEIIFVIANWPETRIEHWKTLLAARALDTQAFIVGVNRIGEGGGLQYSGYSSVYGPRGEKLAETTDEGIAMVDIDTTMVKDWRKKFSSLKDKKIQLYGKLKYRVGGD